MVGSYYLCPAVMTMLLVVRQLGCIPSSLVGLTRIMVPKVQLFPEEAGKLKVF